MRPCRASGRSWLQAGSSHLAPSSHPLVRGTHTHINIQRLFCGVPARGGAGGSVPGRDCGAIFFPGTGEDVSEDGRRTLGPEEGPHGSEIRNAARTAVPREKAATI